MMPQIIQSRVALAKSAFAQAEARRRAARRARFRKFALIFNLLERPGQGDTISN
jgi:hypothetical protein